METKNKFTLTVLSRSVNEGFARAAVSAFAAELDPTIEEIQDIKTAVSEAVTNCIVHAYRDTIGKIYISGEILEGNTLRIKIRDKGCGIDDIKQAMQPLFTTLVGERAGLGFAVMESFSDGIKVTSKKGKGTCVTLIKRISPKYTSNARV